jgi:hypothetical protein
VVEYLDKSKKAPVFTGAFFVIAEGFEPRPPTLNFIGFRLAYVL